MTNKELILKLFKICDKYVEVEDFPEFEAEFAEISKEAGVDLYTEYYGKPFSELKKEYSRYWIVNINYTLSVYYRPPTESVAPSDTLGFAANCFSSADNIKKNKIQCSLFLEQ